MPALLRVPSADFTLAFGWAALPLAKQLRRHRLPAADVKHWQKDADAIVRLSVRGVLSDAERQRARRRLGTQILRAVKAARKER